MELTGIACISLLQKANCLVFLLPDKSIYVMRAEQLQGNLLVEMMVFVLSDCDDVDNMRHLEQVLQKGKESILFDSFFLGIKKAETHVVPIETGQNMNHVWQEVIRLALAHFGAQQVSDLLTYRLGSVAEKLAVLPVTNTLLDFELD
jgi:hypothetical protein